MYEMKEEYYIGIDEIDLQHKELFHIANEAYLLLKDEFIVDKFDEIVAIIVRLRDYAVKHFEDEEKYMLSIGYKRFLSHKAEHTDFLEKVNGIDFDNLDYNQSQTLLDLLEFLNDWLIHHILERDKMFAQA